MDKSIYQRNYELKHNISCKMLYGKKDRNCPQCQELLRNAEFKTNRKRSNEKSNA